MALKTTQLVMRSGPNPGKIFELTQPEITIGRDLSNIVVINDAEVSRHHARLVSQAGGYVIEDLGSTNGTFVNGQRLMGPHLLRHDELVTTGENVSLLFQSPQPDPAMLASKPTIRTAAHDTQVQPQPSPTQPAPPVTPRPIYSGQVPPGPVEPAPDPPPQPVEYHSTEGEEEKSSKNWFLAGCGCLVVVLCILAIAAFAFDYMNLYCQPPFDLLFYCP